MFVKILLLSIVLVALAFTLKDAFKPQKKRTTNKYL